MVYNGPVERDHLVHTNEYCASPNWITRVGWANSRSGQILVNAKSGEETVCIIVGVVSETRFKAGPMGNYNPEFMKFADTKYILGLYEPIDPDFRGDWTIAINALDQAENMIQGTTDHRFFMEQTGNLTSCVSVHEYFKKRYGSLKILMRH